MVFIKVPSLNCVVTTGDFLLASRGTGDGARRSVCVIREVVAPQHVKVSWWLTREELESQGIVGTPSPVSNDGFINLVKCQVKEVFELASTVTLHVCYIVDLAFVFHAVTLEKQFLNCAGMERVFFIRYRFQDNRFSVVQVHQHSPFSKAYAESYPSRMWHFVIEVKYTMEKMLNDPKQYQPCRKMATLKCSLECWQYFCHCMLNSNASYVNFLRKHTEKHMHCDLSLSSVTLKKYLQLIRIDSETSFRFARNLFGVTFGIGIRNRAPKRGAEPVRMHFGDVVNMVDVSAVDSNAVDDRVSEFVRNPGIDFFYDSNARILKIRVRYCRFLAQSEGVLSMLQLNRVLPQRPEIEAEWSLNDVEPGTIFMRNGVVVEVVAVMDRSVLIREEITLDELTITHDEARDLINQFLM